MKEKLVEIKSRLEALKSRIEADDTEAIAEAKQLKADYEETLKAVEAAEEKSKLLAMIGEKPEKEGNATMKNAKSLGENFVEHLKNTPHEKRFNISAPAFKGATDPETSPAGAVEFATTYDRNVVTAPRTELVVRDLFGAETISGSTLVYLVEGAIEGAPAVTAEGAKKPQVHFADPTPVTVSLKKIAEFIKESDEYINDYPFLASAINGRLLYALGLTEQNTLVTDLLATSGIQTGDTVVGNNVSDLAERILKAVTDVQEESGFAADVIVMNPSTWFALRTAKDNNGQYYGGGFFGAQDIPNLWGTPVCVTTAVTAAQIIVGAFKTCGSVITNGGIAVDATNTNKDDFEYNLMTIRAEERLALAVRRPAGFKLLTSYTYTKGSAGDKAVADTTYYVQSGNAGAYVYTAVPASEITVGTTDVSGYYTRA